MVGRFVSNDEYFRKYIFWLITFSTMVIIGGVGIAVKDHYSFINHRENSMEINKQQTEDIKETNKQLQNLIEHLNIYANTKDKEDAVIKTKIENLEKDVTKLEGKVRGGDVSFHRSNVFEPLGM